MAPVGLASLGDFVDVRCPADGLEGAELVGGSGSSELGHALSAVRSQQAVVGEGVVVLCVLELLQCPSFDSVIGRCWGPVFLGRGLFVLKARGN